MQTHKYTGDRYSVQKKVIVYNMTMILSSKTSGLRVSNIYVGIKKLQIRNRKCEKHSAGQKAFVEGETEFQVEDPSTELQKRKCQFKVIG